MLRPFSNFLVVRPSPGDELAHFEQRLVADPEFTETWQPAPGWLAAVAPVPGGEPDPEIVRRLGLLFAEGRDVVSGSGSERELRRAAVLAENEPAQLAALPGDFSFAHFGETGSATLVRSCAGMAPVYVHEVGSLVAFSTRLAYMPRYFETARDLDPMVNALWAGGWAIFPEGRTPLRAVRVVPPGHFAVARRSGRSRLGRYWDPRQITPEPRPSPDHAPRLREILISVIERDLQRSGGNLLLLSGGVDSSALAGLAAGTLGYPVSTLTLYGRDEPNLEENTHYVDHASQAAGIDRRWWLELSEESLPAVVGNLPRTPFYVTPFALAAIPSIRARAEVDVVFGGEFADQVCGSLHTLADWAAMTPLRAIMSGRARLPRGGVDMLVWLKRRLATAVHRPLMPLPPDLPPWFRDEVQAEYRQWYRRRRAELADDRRPLASLSVQAELHGFAQSWWEGALPLGLRRSFPFYNRELHELAFSCHPAELVGPGFKRLLRESLSEDVPKLNLQRPAKDASGAERTWTMSLPTDPVPRSLDPILRDDWRVLPSARSVEGFLSLSGLIRFASAIEGQATCSSKLQEGTSVEGFISERG